jgi:hypothetical protein
MTEHEAWLEAAKMFEGTKPLPWLFKGRQIVGICQAPTYFHQEKKISYCVREDMKERVERYFNGGKRYGEWEWYYWPGASRAPRATACGLLAAMTNDKP